MATAEAIAGFAAVAAVVIWRGGRASTATAAQMDGREAHAVLRD